MPDETILAVVRNFHLDGISRTRGDLVFTDQRLLFLKTAGNVDVTQSLLGVWGLLLSQKHSNKVSNDLGHLSVGEMRASPALKSDLPYVELESVELVPRTLRKSVVRVRPRNGRKKKFWGRRKDLQPLLDAAPSMVTSGVPLRTPDA